MREAEISEILGPIALLVSVVFALAVAMALRDRSQPAEALPVAAGCYVCVGEVCERVEELQLTVLGNGRVRVDGREIPIPELADVVRYERGPEARVTMHIRAVAGAGALEARALAVALAQIGIPARSIKFDGLPVRGQR